MGIDAARWVTRAGCRSVLAMVHTVASGHRLLDVLELIESDTRVQVVFTQAPDAFGNGVSDFLQATEGVVLPWQQACRERFDLALAAANGELHRVHAPLVLMAHGAGRGKLCRPPDTSTPLVAPTVHGLDAPRLIRDGRVVPSAVVLSHDSELDVLRRQCPDAVGVATVAGDPCYDRLLASLPLRADYRAALGVANHQELVVVSSTWGGDSLFAHCPDLLPALLDELPPDGFRVAALIHPAVWFGHGPRQVRAWLADARDAGLLLLGPEVDWRAAVVAADTVIGDHGSVTVYAAAIGRPVLLTDPPACQITAAQSPQAVLRRSAPQLASDQSMLTQLRAAGRRRLHARDAVARRLTSRPGTAGAELRRTIYRLLDLPEPGRHRRATPVPIPELPWLRAS